MADFTCSACGKGNMELKTIPEHATALGGVPFVARDAQVYECSHCGAWTATGKELKRWRAQQQIELQAKGAVPSGADVRRVREAFGLSVSDFASLLAVTRQTVHAWERRRRPRDAARACSASRQGIGERAGATSHNPIRSPDRRSPKPWCVSILESTPRRRKCNREPKSACLPHLTTKPPQRESRFRD